MEKELATQQAASVLSVIEKAVENKDVDIDKMQQLLDMQERIMDKNAEAAFNQSMVKAMSEIPSFEETANGHKFKYATFESINKVVKPILAENDLFMSFTTNFKEGGVMVTAVVTHKDGHAIQSTGLYPFDTSGSKNDIQAVGSAIAYGCRYQQKALLNITTHGEDDDGFASDKKLTKEQISKLNDGLIKAGVKSDGLCDYMQVDKLSDISFEKFSEAVQFLTNLIEAKQK